MKKALIVGGTGQLGRLSVQRLRDAGFAVRCLVRPGHESEVTQKFSAAGVELFPGDLKDGSSLSAACREVDVVVSMASATSSQNADDTIETVDNLGNVRLVEAAASARVPRFVFVAFADIATEFALKQAKSNVVARLKATPSMTHAVLKPAYFMDTWLPFVAPSAPGHPAVFFGKGDAKVSWIAREDVAHAVVAASQSTVQDGGVALGGPDALSLLEVFEMFQAQGARQVERLFFDHDTLGKELTAAQASNNQLGEAFAALKLGIANGLPITGSVPDGWLPANRTKVAEFVSRYLEMTPAARG